MTARDDLRGNMGTSEYKEDILGMLFLKRASYLFDQRRAQIRRQGEAAGMSVDDIHALLEDADQYSGKYFYVPRARWSEPWTEHVNGEPLLHPALKHVKETLVGCHADRARGARRRR